MILSPAGKGEGAQQDSSAYFLTECLISRSRVHILLGKYEFITSNSLFKGIGGAGRRGGKGRVHIHP